MDVGYFSFSSKVENLLFKDVSVSSLGGMVGLCIGIAAFTFLYEGIKSLRHHIVILYGKTKYSSVPADETDNSSEVKYCCFTNSFQKTRDRLKFHFLQTILHMLQLTMGYMIMLIIMSYNAWFLIIIVFVTAVCFYVHEFVLSRKPLTLPVEIPNANL